MSVASGPSISVPADTVSVFATSGVFTPAFTGTVEVLVVGGGGAGGGGIGGGGGGGGVVYMPAVSVTSGTAYTITVGAGGAAVLYSGTGGSGGDSTAFGATAKGGGGSGVHDSGAGVAGGSGGGAASNNSVLNQGGASSGNSLGSNTGTIYGNRGGNMTAARAGGPTAAAGGGGAGAAAADTNSNNVQTSPGAANGRGGAGVANSILGTMYYWAGGGGGGAYFNGYAGDGGIGGGGGGSCSAGAGPTRGGGNGLNSGIGAAIDTNGAPGAMNTGGGGGGGAWQVTFGGAGGSGIVIIRYNSALGSSTGGASTSLGDMVICLDAGNPQSNLGNRSIINWNNWTTGSGSITGYNQNGQTAENERVNASNPWNNTAVVWEARPLAETNDDGGWNTDWFNIDNTQMYRFSVWVRRTSSTSGGTFYFGMYANGDGSRRMDNNTVEGNAYWECSGTSGLVQNTWYLWVGHVYPANTTFTGRNPNTGYYTVNGRVGNINGCNIGSGDLKWSTNSTQGIHRTYLYYCADNTTRLQFYQPRVDLCDGTEPSIQELLNDAGNTLYDVSGGSNNGILFNGPTFNNGVLSFDGINDYMQANINSTLLDGDPTFSVDMFVRRRTGTNIGGNAGFWGIGGTGQGNSAEGWTPTPNVIHLDIYDSTRLESAATYPEGSFVHIVWTKNGPGVETTNTKCYVNGSEVTLTKTRNASRANQFNTSTPGAGVCLGRINGDAAGFNAPIDVGVFKVYSSALTAAQVLQNFNALRGRYGI